MTTTGSGAPPENTSGGGAAPPTHHRPPGAGATERPSGRAERRRLTERLAEAAETAREHRVRGMPNASPWQRSNAVWHHGGVDWTRPEPDDSPHAAPAVPAAAYPTVPAATSAPPDRPAVGAPPPAGTRPVSTPSAGAPPAGTPGAEPWDVSARPRRARRVPLRPVAVVAAAVVVLGGGAYAAFGLGGGTANTPAQPAAVLANRMFAADPAAKSSGRAHPLAGVATAGSTVVTIGSEQGGVYSRAQFLTSADGGRTWRPARIRSADGGDPPQGEFPQMVAGTQGAWAALGVTPSGVVAWTSRDARTWTRHAVTGGFAAGDKLTGLARTGSGFVAAGTATVKGGTQAVLWTSPDGRTWTRVGPDRFAGKSAGGAVQMTGVTAHGAVILAHGVLQTTRTVKHKKKKVHRTVRGEAFWRSPDGGRTWAAVSIPQAQGSSGSAVGVAATQAGFFAVRAASHTTGKKKHRKTVHYAVVFGSQDGTKWAPAGRLSIDGYSRVRALRGAESGLTALVSVSGGKTAVLTSGDGKAWRRTGDVPAGRDITDVALAPVGPVVTGRLPTGDPYLTVPGAGDVDVTAIPGAVHPERTVDAVVSGAGRVVAAGSSNGGAALWVTPDGRTWHRATLPAGSGPARLADAVHGTAGWLAAGHAGDHALLLTSADGGTWQQVPDGKALGASGVAPAAAAARGGTYVVAGRQSGTAAGVWYSTDLRTWAAGGNAGHSDLTGADGAPKWIADVVAGPAGFVAVGGQTVGKAARPAVWTSPDGRTWTLSPSGPQLPGGTTAAALTTVTARGGVLVASGTAGAAGAPGTAGATGAPSAGAPGSHAFAAVSADGGRTWQRVTLPGADPGTGVTAATVTPHGFTVAGEAGSDVVLWTSADGRSWRLSRPRGRGLAGAGVQRLTGLTALGGDLLGVGFTADSAGDAPTLWRTPAAAPSS